MTTSGVLASILIFGMLFNPAPEAPDQVNVEAVEQQAEIVMSEINTTPASELLTSLVEPKEKIAVAVYNIQDKTGQYKDDEHLRNSSIVTQGATEMLVTALMKSRQFKVLDRIHFQNLLNEQNLKLNERVKGKNNGPNLGALIGAEYILEGAITEYDVDKNTGGFGLKIAGKGGSKEYARATCAVDLRITDTTSGEVIWARSLKKEIYGEKVGLTLFSFMGDNIVELETGRGRQQAINLVVRTLLEEAVYKLCKSDVVK